MLCWQIWLAINKSIFKDQIPRVGKILSKTWSLISESLNSKGMTTVDQNNLQQEERDWYGKITSENKGIEGPNKALTTKNWKLRLNEKEFEEWRKRQKSFSLFFRWGLKKQPKKIRCRRSNQWSKWENDYILWMGPRRIYKQQSWSI